jgi:hypothetical protein
MSDDFSLTELLDDEPLIDVAEFEEISDFVGPAQVMAVIERLMGSTKLNEKDRERLELVKERLERDEVNGEDIAFVALLKRLLLEGGDPLDENEEDFDDDSNKDDDTKIDPDEDFKRLFESMKPIGEHRHAIYADGVSLSFQADSFEIDKELGTVSIFGYEILRTGVWNGIKFESGDLDEIAGNFSKLSTGKTPFVQVPVKLGHHDDQALLTNSGEAAAGMLTKVARKGERLLADIKSIPIKVFELMRRSAFNSRSVELFFGFRNDAGKKFGKVLKALALLGVSTPAVKGMKTLDDLLGLYEFDDSETDREVVVLFFREEEAVSDDTKPTKDADDTKPEPKPEPQPKVQTFSQEDLDKRLAAEREKHEAEMKKLRDEQLRLSESLRVGTRDRNRERNEAVYSSLLNEGKILPKQKAKFLAILNAIDGYEDLASGSEVESVYFSDRGFDAKTLTFEVSTKDDEGKDVTRRESLKTMLVGLFSGLEKQVEFDTKSEEVDSKDTDKKSDDKGTDDGDKPFSERVYDRAVEMQAEAKKDGKDIGLTDALEAASIELAKGLDAEVVNN